MRGINPLTMVPDVNPITLVEADTYDLLKSNQIFDLLQLVGRFLLVRGFLITKSALSTF